MEGRLGGSVSWASDFGSGHDLAVCEFEPRIGLCAQSLEPVSDSVSPSLSAPPYSLALSVSLSKINRGTWVAQSVGHPTSAQVMILQSMSSSPTSGSVLTAQSLLQIQIGRAHV